MALTATNPWLPQKIKSNATLYVIPQDGTFYPENTAAEADLTKVTDKWKNVAAIKSISYKQDTEDDESEYFDANTHIRVSEDNTVIKKRTYELELERYTLVYEALFHGVANPLADATIAQMSAESETGVPIYRSTDPNVPVGVKMELWDAAQHKYLTRYFYANLKADGEQSLDGKILRPKITLEVIASTWNVEKLEQAMTGQTTAGDV